jgi:hypothetical protein
MQTESSIQNRFSVYIAIITAAITIITFAIALMTPPLSGPLCQSACFEYPYTDAISRFPRDYFWMYPAMIVSVLFVALMASVYEFADIGKKIYALTGLSFAVISSMILITDYFIQVTIIQPSLLKGETEGIALWSQYNPHGIFIALEEIGYLLICISLVAVAPVFAGKDNLYRSLRITCIAGFLLAICALVFVSVQHGIMREYIFEIIIISIAWFELIVFSLLLQKVFQKIKTLSN